MGEIVEKEDLVDALRAGSLVRIAHGRWLISRNALIYDRPIQVVAGTQDVRPVSSLDDDWGGHNSQSSLDVFELTCLLATTIDRLLPIIQVSLQGVSSSQALLQITQDVDRIDAAARRLAPKSPGLGRSIFCQALRSKLTGQHLSFSACWV